MVAIGRPALGLCFGDGPGNVQPRQNRQCDQHVPCKRDKRTEERSRSELACELDGFRSQASADNTAYEHERNRGGLVRWCGDFRRREALLQADCVVDADDRRRGAEQHETALGGREHPGGHPATWMSAPAMKPRRWPTRAIHSAIGSVPGAEPIT